MIGFIMLLIVGLFVGILLLVMKKVDPAGQDASESSKTAQEFLPFQDIRDDMILLGQHRYRAVLVCTSTNYHLKTESEKDIIEMSFQRFLNTISFPITFFLQTKVIDNTERLNILDGEIKRVVQDFPGISGYAEQYKHDMATLNQKLGNNQQKKRYIIITYDDVGDLSQLSENEKILHASKEVRTRANIVTSNLESVGVNAYMLDTKELIELVYSSYNRDNYSYAEDIYNGDCFSNFVSGNEDRFKDATKVQLLDIILGEALEKMKCENISNDLTVGKVAMKDLEELRAKYCSDISE